MPERRSCPTENHNIRTGHKQGRHESVRKEGDDSKRIQISTSQ